MFVISDPLAKANGNLKINKITEGVSLGALLHISSIPNPQSQIQNKKSPVHECTGLFPLRRPDVCLMLKKQRAKHTQNRA
jgi:hypothetical protein